MTSFNISCKIDLLTTNSVHFCLSEKELYFSFTLVEWFCRVQKYTLAISSPSSSLSLSHSTLNIWLYSFCLHGFWEEVRGNFYLVILWGLLSSFGFFQDFSFKFLILCSLKMICVCVVCCLFVWSLFYLVFSELPASMTWCLILIWGESESLLFQIFIFLLISSLHIYTFCKSSTVLGYCLFFYCFAIILWGAEVEET